MRCPTLDEITQATLALLPRGRAWQSNESGPQPGYDIAFAPNAYQNNAFATSAKRKSYLWHYWRSFAVVSHWLNERACALREEFWCSTINETRDDWMVEYGLPDPCDPFPDLCTKVTAIGGTRCEYYAEVAARMGWTIECQETREFCGSRAGCALAGRARAGRVINSSQLKIVVYLNESPAYEGGNTGLASLAGRMRAGRKHNCGPNYNALKCLMSRVVHAEIQIVYEGNNG